MQELLKHVKGKDKGNVVLFALSTCVWCKKTKRLLENLGVDYHYVDVDLLEENEKQKVVKEVKRWCKKISYPLLVVKNKKSIQGYEEERIIKELK